MESVTSFPTSSMKPPATRHQAKKTRMTTTTTTTTKPPSGGATFSASIKVNFSKTKPTVFRSKVNNANQTAICTSTSDQVGRRTLRRLLVPASNNSKDNNNSNNNQAYEVPIFQRRYCWTTTQWDTLWIDVLKRKTIKHSLGRLTCTNIVVPEQVQSPGSTTLSHISSTSNYRSVILDGQQRFTSITLVLAAIRDALIGLPNSGGGRNDVLLKSINEMLFLDVEAMQEWVVKNEGNKVITEGVTLEFCRLIPTFCDRSSYLAAILPPSSTQAQYFVEDTFNPRWHRPLVAKQYFLQKINSLIAPSSSNQFSPRDILQKLIKFLLDGVDILYFPIDISRGMKDGTEDLQVVYERLALRDATWTKPQRTTEYQSMDGTDMIRNLFLGSFRSQLATIDYYKTYWLPFERLHQQRLQENDYDDSSECMKKVFEAFLKEERSKLDDHNQVNSGIPPVSMIIGGRIYVDFEIWFTQDFDRWQTKSQPSSAEDHSRDVGRRLL